VNSAFFVAGSWKIAQKLRKIADFFVLSRKLTLQQRFFRQKILFFLGYFAEKIILST